MKRIVIMFVLGILMSVLFGCSDVFVINSNITTTESNTIDMTTTVTSSQLTTPTITESSILSTTENTSQNCEEYQELFDDVCKIRLFNGSFYDLDQDVKYSMAMHPFREISYIDDKMVVYTDRGYLYIAREGEDLQTLPMEGADENDDKQVAGSYDPDSSTFLYRYNNMIYKMDTTTGISTEVGVCGDGYVFSSDGAIAIHGNDISLYNVLGEEVQSFNNADVILKHPSDSDQIFFIDGGNSVYLYRGLTLLYSETFYGDAQIFYVNGLYYVLQIETETERILVSIDKDGNFMNSVSFSNSFIMTSISGNLIKVFDGVNVLYYHFNLELGELNGNVDMVVDMDSEFYYVKELNNDIKKYSISTNELLATYVGYNWVSAIHGYAYLYNISGNPYVGDLYGPDNELMMEDIYQVIAVSEAAAFFTAENNGSFYNPYMLDLYSGEITSLSIMSLQAYNFYIFDNYVAFILKVPRTSYYTDEKLAYAQYLVYDFSGRYLGEYIKSSFFGRPVLLDENNYYFELTNQPVASTLFYEEKYF